MNAIVNTAPGKLEWQDLPSSADPATAALIEPLAVAGELGATRTVNYHQVGDTNLG